MIFFNAGILDSLINKCHKLTRVRAKICVSEKFSSIFLMLEYYLNSLINKGHTLIRVRTKFANLKNLHLDFNLCVF